MTSEPDLAYIAGIIDGEGYVGIKKSAAHVKLHQRRTLGYHARIQVRMIHEGAIRFLAETLGGWYYPEKPHSAQGRLLFCYQASDRSAEMILRAVLPYLRVKRANADTVLDLRALQAQSVNHRTKVVGYRNFPNSYGTARNVENRVLSDEYIAMCEALWQRCKDLNHGVAPL